MDLKPPPETNDINEIKEYLLYMYERLKYPDKLEVQFIELQELTADPDAPSGNRVRIFAKDSGASKTQFSARFSTGASQTIAEEP